ncbi:hypothetical protein VV02_02300 [Luteipulveratus mongoliensis]|uniref:Zinc finger DksA/TraR C4-type domain-containing protein n=2 Tax=Luteipulveratus mongoliensis TaxID=571913 RepID=A0A0K1JPB9_9MICO|nr:hypothetical protein VV02_02300 [Luteipulveratus mongoliensis]
MGRLADLRRLEAQIIDASQDDNADDEHDPEGATIAWDRAQTLALAEEARARIDEIGSALARIAVGWDGRCASCDQPIDHERLLARPTTDRCIRCA